MQLLGLILISIIIVALLSPKWLKSEHFISSSYITDNIASGNPVSWSNQINTRKPDPVSGPRFPIVYQGSGIPLSYEDRPTAPVKDSMNIFDQTDCRPDCCTLNSYSCGHGCVCWQPRGDPVPAIQQLSTISPRS